MRAAFQVALLSVGGFAMTACFPPSCPVGQVRTPVFETSAILTPHTPYYVCVNDAPGTVSSVESTSVATLARAGLTPLGNEVPVEIVNATPAPLESGAAGGAAPTRRGSLRSFVLQT